MKILKYLINHIRCGFLFIHSTPMVLHNPMNTPPRYLNSRKRLVCGLWIALVAMLMVHTAQAQTTNTTDFVTTWRVGAADLGITIPTFTGATYDYTVDWGDATTTNNHTGDATHTYTTQDDYEVRISGAFPRIYFNNAGDRMKIIAINQWGDQQWTSMANAFQGATNLAGQATDEPDLSMVTNMANMFNRAAAFNQDIGSWNVSNVINMSSMFAGTGVFNQDIGSWNVSNVINMSSMFARAGSFNQDIGRWNVGSVTDMNDMFISSRSFNQAIGGWDVSKVIDMTNMLSTTRVFNQAIGDWDVSAVRDMDFMFAEAEAFNQDIGDWDVSSVITMRFMFQFARAFNQDIGEWDVTAVGTMALMFAGATAFNQDIGDWDVSRVGTMELMFSGAGLSTNNYDSLLRGWSTIEADESALVSDVTFHGGNSTYCAGTAARTALTSAPNNWTITEDGGQSCSVATDITAFSFTQQIGAAVINEVAHTIAVGVAAGTSLTALVPTIAVSSGATIAPASGVAQDFSNNVAYTVTAQDGSTTQAWTVTVTVNVAPADITLANSTIDENNAVNAVIGGLSATDGNASDAHTYSLAAGTGDTDNASFSISGSNLVAAEVFDHEMKSDYSVRIAAADDNGGTFAKAFALTVNNLVNISQTITFGALAAMTFGGSSFDLTATASSGLDVTYSSSDGSVATIAGNMVTIVGAGTTTITASQAGDDDYAVATVVAQNLVVTKQAQTITFGALAAMTFGDGTFDLAARATSGLDVTYSSSDGSVATIAESTVTIVGAGTTVITASQAGDDDYAAATVVAQSLVVNQTDQTIMLTPVADKVTTDAPFEVVASSTSRLPVTFTVVSGPAMISGTTLTLDGTAGTVTITADQAGNNNYHAASSVVQSFEVVDMRTVTGIEEEAPDKILLHPIPANNTIYIDMGNQKLLEMTVTDLNGKQLTVHAKDSQLDISSLKEGYYILRITTDQGVFSQKIIKQ